MLKSEKGYVLVIFIFIFAALAIVGAMLAYKTFTQATKKLSQASDQVSIALKTEYSNPFDEKTQYENPFSETHNPFDDLK